ncbi:MAG TPA: hypothetical protein VIH98_13260 [Xanthobacteraceae bacterium]
MRTTFTAAGCAALLALLASSPPLLAQQKTARECRAEWSANREAIAASGKTQRVFIAECRGVPVPASTRAAAAELGKGQYATEAEAKANCQGDAVVWANLRSKVYHDSSSRNYGATKIGAYMCEKESIAAGFHAPKAARDPGRDISKPASS